MKSFAVLVAVFAMAVAKPGALTPLLTPVVTPIVGPVSTQYHAQDVLGQYNYGYSNQLSSKAEIKTADGITQGGYTYLDADGKIQTVQYTSDAVNGFKVSATNLPVAPQAPEFAPLPHPEPVQDTPEVSAAKAKHFMAVKEAEAQAEAQQQEQEQVQEEGQEQEQGQEQSQSEQVKPVQYAAVAYQSPIAYSTPLAYASPLGYSYAYPTPYAYTGYSAVPYVAQFYSAPILGVPAVPAETAEVAKAKAEHLAAVSEAKARSL